MCPAPNWSRLTDRDQLIGYMERARVGPEGRLVKLDAVCAALKFMRVVVIDDNSNPLYLQATKMENVVVGWKNTLRKQQRKLRKKRLQELSSETLSLEEAASLLECHKLWTDFNETCVAAERKEAVSTRALDRSTICLAGSLLLKNWQRPGAVANATLKEFEDSKLISEILYVLSVENHTTSMEGYSKVVF